MHVNTAIDLYQFTYKNRVLHLSNFKRKTYDLLEIYNNNNN